MKKIKYYISRIKSASLKNLKFAINESHKKSHKNRLIIFLDMIYCFIRYSAGYMDYYYCAFYKANKKQRKSFITRSINNKYIETLNDRNYAYIFDDKAIFNEKFNEYIKRDYLDLRKNDLNDFQNFIQKHPTFIAKPINLQCGQKVEKIITNKKTNNEELYHKLIKNEQLLIEECVTQHEKLSQLCDTSVNTLRIVTARKNHQTTILFRLIRIGNGKNVVDNFHQGGMCSIFDEYGTITRPAIDKNDNLYTYHPKTKTKIEGFKIPYYEEALELCQKASEKVEQIGLVGWDVAITPDGPVLIEGNNLPSYDFYQTKNHLDQNGCGPKEKFDQIILNKKPKPNFKFYLAFYYYKIIIFLQKITKRENKIYPAFTNKLFKICPRYLTYIAKPKTVISVMGTNGKTTICNLLKDSLENMGYKVINNIEFSYTTGISHCFTKYATNRNKSEYDFAIIETDELTSGEIFEHLKPDYIIVTNLFRDSIKLNDNTEYIFTKMKEAIPENTKLILNADDLISSALKKNKTILYGVDNLNYPERNYIVKDIVLCPNCQTNLKYITRQYNHIGQAYCPKCGFKSPTPNYLLTKVENNKCLINDIEYPLISDSIFNIYNEVALISLLNELNIDHNTICNALKNIHITNTRMKTYKIKNKDFICLLAKGQNPVACSSVLNYIANDNEKMDIILMLDDLKDNKKSSETISWFYDTDFEFLNKENINSILIAGPRAKDLYVRLLLANIPQKKIKTTLNEEEIPEYIDINNIKKLYFLYDIYSLQLARNIEKEIIRKSENND